MNERSMKEIYYADYLQLDRLLNSQLPESRRHGPEAHDEMLFIITHQAYEIWFKQILHELKSVLAAFTVTPLDEHSMGVIVARLERIIAIQKVLNQQIDVLETITPLDFLDFRDYLIPASGFQSVQFREIELRLGLGVHYQYPVTGRLRAEDVAYLREVAGEPGLFQQVDAWLARMPFLRFEGYDFWESYHEAVAAMLAKDRRSIEKNSLFSDAERNAQLAELDNTRRKFECLLDPAGFEQLQAQDLFHLRQTSVLSALFIQLYRDEPILHLPFRLLSHLMDIDELFTAWRGRHALMAQRMLGSKIGTGGSSGHEYLQQTVDKKRIFKDLFNLSTFLIPRSSLPPLPRRLKQSLDFHFTGEQSS
ncbi:tryptophan 2,3-dioxygenase [Methylocaldum marinum]|uniref:Tryptophan 2,3-dioxygenase n=1 Tax=Methylocaldum marinum TaxID=1432792 RepID=A0A286T5L8_9GAMM|nr:tryptophan 2,3-dioxygenase family protein [Methylocaldum marinum]BBA32014.1 tryptophan 2,3-dioxygenase [Methylocaldum marinum]